LKLPSNNRSNNYLNTDKAGRTFFQRPAFVFDIGEVICAGLITVINWLYEKAFTQLFDLSFIGGKP
jgi:hypothetical protein